MVTLEAIGQTSPPEPHARVRQEGGYGYEDAARDREHQQGQLEGRSGGRRGWSEDARRAHRPAVPRRGGEDAGDRRRSREPETGEGPLPTCLETTIPATIPNAICETANQNQSIRRSSNGLTIPTTVWSRPDPSIGAANAAISAKRRETMGKVAA